MTQLPDTPPTEAALRVARIVAPVAALVMAVTLLLGLLAAPQGAVAELLDNVWGRVTIVDLYLALLAVWIWIVWRERSVGAAVLWGMLLVVTGSVALWTYITWRASTARDFQELLLGPHDISG